MNSLCRIFKVAVNEHAPEILFRNNNNTTCLKPGFAPKVLLDFPLLIYLVTCVLEETSLIHRYPYQTN